MKEVSHAVRRLIAIRPQCDRKGVLHGPGGCEMKMKTPWRAGFSPREALASLPHQRD
jgi:hypothetical protein